MPEGAFSTADDVRWLGSISDVELQDRVLTGCDVEFVGFPANCSIALDLRVYDSGLKLVRGVPVQPAVHLVALLSGGDGAPPSSACVGVFITCRCAQTIAIEYLAESASVRVQVVDHRSGSVMDNNVGDRGVAVYTPNHEKDWSELADKVDEQFMAFSKIASLLKAVCAERNDDQVEERKHENSSARVQASMPGLLSIDALPKIRRGDGMSASEVTHFNLDRSAYVMYLVASRYQGKIDYLLGEFQISFLCFMLLRSLPGLHHWSSILREVCLSSELVEDATEFISKFARTLRYQLHLVDADTLAAIGDELKEAVMRFVSDAENAVAEVCPLRDTIRTQFGWY